MLWVKSGAFVSLMRNLPAVLARVLAPFGGPCSSARRATKERPLSIPSSSHSIPVIIGIPSLTGSFELPGLSLEVHS